MSKWWVSLGVLVLAAGCAPGGGDRVAGTRQAIVGADGTDSDTDARYPSVVHVRIPVSEGGGRSGLGIARCTGTLITPSHVLTAGHCVAIWQSDRGPITVHFGREPIEYDPDVIGGGTNVELHSVTARSCAIHPTLYEGRGCGDIADESEVDVIDPQGQHDLALLTLAQPVPVTWASVSETTFVADFHRLLDPGEEPSGGWIGEPLDLVGYGSIASGVLVESQFGIRRWVELPVEALVFPSRPGSWAGPELPWGEEVFAMQYSVLDLNEAGADFRGGSLGDSGGPIIWRGGAARSGRLFPVVGTFIGHNFYTSLQRADNRDWLNSSLDTDSDGRWDTSCPTDPGYSPLSTPENDRDGDGHLDSEDECPDAYDPCQEDRDDDGVGDACDTCLRDRNPGAAQETDFDGDGVPDACDNCVRDPNPDQRDIDFVESDGSFPTGDGAGDVCDNCPNLVNDGQADCNLDAEEQLILSTPPLPCTPACRTGELCVDRGLGPFCLRVVFGDACDPNPCGETILQPREERPAGSSIAVMRTTDVRIDGLAAVTTPVRARTGLRFCMCGVGAGRDERAERERCATDLTAQCTISALADYDAPVEPANWRRTTMEFVAPAPVVGAETLREAVTSYTDPAEALRSELAAVWAIDSDIRRWAISVGSRPSGVLWTHTPGPQGRRPDVFPLFPLAQRRFTSHYLSARLDLGRTLRAVGPFECSLPIAPSLIPPSDCLTCDGSFPGAWLTLPFPVRGLFGRCFGPPPDLPVVRLPGRITDAYPMLASGVGESMAARDSLWIAAAERDAWLPRFGAKYVQVTPDGSAVGAVLVETPAGLGPRGLQFPDGPPFPDQGLLGVTATAQSGPAGRSQHGVVVSSRRDTLWVIGGVGSDGRELGDLWAFNLTARRWMPVTLASGVRPARVLAATYSAVDDALLVLDELPDDRGRPRVRLLQVDALGESVAEVASWRRLTRHTVFAMASDQSGGLYIAASPETIGPHAIVRAAFDRHHHLRVTGFRVGPGVLADRQIQIGRRGATLLIRQPLRDAEPVGYALEDLVPAGLEAFDRCF